jgi:TolB protein
MKKILLTLLLVNYIFSELIIEITKSSENLIKVAVIQKQQATKIGDLVVGVIEQDLKRTGEFEVLTKDQMLSIPTKESEVIQRDWLLLEVDAIIFFGY